MHRPREERPRDRLGIEFISVLGQSPVEFIALARRLGCGNIGLAPSPITGPLAGEPNWNLRRNPALARATKQALVNEGVRLSLAEGFLIMPGHNIADAEADIELMAELGAERLNACAMEPDAARNIDQFAAFAAMAGGRGLPVTVEFIPGTPVCDLKAALRLVAASRAANAHVLVDAMHLFCSGGTAEELAAVTPDLIGYAQLCDAKQASFYDGYFDDARGNRPGPGEGVLPLAQFVRALPATCPIGLEVPMLVKAAAGIGHEARLGPCVATARALLAGAEEG
jgi:sugar phosphate isomerase/epimerase